MMMMQIPRVNEFKSQVSDYNRALKNDPIQQTSFQSEYDKKLDNTTKVEVRTNADKKVVSDDIEQSSQNVDSKKETETNNVKNSKESNETKYINSSEEVKDSSSTSEKEVKITDSIIETLTNSEDKDSKNSDVSKKIKNSKKEISKQDKESDNKKNVKNSDKDTLNQSLVVSQNIQTPVENKNKTEQKESDQKTGDDSVKISEAVKSNSETGTVKRVPLNVSTEKNISKSESKKEKSQKSESKIKVNDLRTESKKGIDNSDNLAKKSSNELKSMTDVESVDSELSESGLDKTIVLGTTEVTAEGDGGKSQAPVMKEATSLLKQQLKDFGNNEIVKQSRFILKDNNVGEIKLILKPEALGQVKINLNLNENSLAGQIVVENNSVKEVFQENLGQLSKALEDQGFDSAKLDISLNDKEGSEDQNKHKKNKQYFSDRLKRIDESGQVVRYGAPTAGINLTA